MILLSIINKFDKHVMQYELQVIFLGEYSGPTVIISTSFVVTASRLYIYIFIHVLHLKSQIGRFTFRNREND